MKEGIIMANLNEVQEERRSDLVYILEAFLRHKDNEKALIEDLHNYGLKDLNTKKDVNEYIKFIRTSIPRETFNEILSVHSEKIKENKTSEEKYYEYLEELAASENRVDFNGYK